MLTLENLLLKQGSFCLQADLTIEPEKKVAILGASGGGKSTLLATIAGFLVPSQGRVIWKNTDITATAPAKRPVSMVFQDNNLFPHMTVEQNVGLGLSPSLKLNTDGRPRVAAAIARVGLDGLNKRKPSALSGGQIARVALARLLVQDNPVMLLDEPFAALGPGMRAEMLDLVSELAKESGATLLMVSHAPEDALRIADQVIVVADGAANLPVSTETLFSNPPKAMRDWLGQD